MTCTALCQDKLVFGDTPTTTKSPKYKSNPKDHKTKHPIYWVKQSSKGLLIGNPCMEEITQEMGFVYLVQPKGQAYNDNGFERNLHNFFAKLRITLKNGPFWKFKLKKWRKRCRAETGDFVG
ncbi:hypothetical protein [Fulvivirga lutea]|uniref:Uncharacterized protein n=1 Tax=Fulvivirga lutea TaxID=2810512 RepID=A0A974WIE3_9BACT|nr:hypothetical protein [Fulvivirga lutea]QSE99118.1 hypothetical protein JR347_08530 [Fulvivirga lutea]